MTDINSYISNEFISFITVENDGKSIITSDGASKYFNLVGDGISFKQSLNRPQSDLFQFLTHPEQNHKSDDILTWVEKGIPDTAIADIGWFLMGEGNNRARLLCKGFNRFSVRSIFHYAVGWKPNYEYGLNAAEHMIRCILPEPKRQETPYDEAFVEAFEALYLFDFGTGNSRWLIGHWVWNRFGDEFVKTLRNTNKLAFDKMGRVLNHRQDSHYNHLTPELRTWLDKHVRTLTRLMNKASRLSSYKEYNMKMFREYMKNVPYIVDELAEVIRQQLKLDYKPNLFLPPEPQV